MSAPPGQLRSFAVVPDTAEIATLLVARNLPRTHQHPWAHGPLAPAVTVVVDARTGTTYPVVPSPPVPRPGPADLTYPKIHDEALRFRAVAMDPRDDFDQTGFARPRAPVDPAYEPGHGELFTDDCPQPAAAASEPVFWTETTRPDVQSHPPAAAAADLAADTARADPTAGDVPADASEPA